MIENTHSVPALGSPSTTVRRAVLFFALWLVISGLKLMDIPVGLATAALATWASLKLLPPERTGSHPLRILALSGQFMGQSIVAGLDVARRAFNPRLPLAPGFKTCALQDVSGTRHDAFCTYSSLLPGTLPVGMTADGKLVIHCLDTGQTNAADVTRQEQEFMHAIGHD